MALLENVWVVALRLHRNQTFRFGQSDLKSRSCMLVCKTVDLVCSCLCLSLKCLFWHYPDARTHLVQQMELLKHVAADKLLLHGIDQIQWQFLSLNISCTKHINELSPIDMHHQLYDRSFWLVNRLYLNEWQVVFSFRCFVLSWSFWQTY